MSPDISAVYRRAAEVLTERGWCQDDTEDESGRLCAIGAIRVADGSPADGGDDQDRDDELLRPLHHHVGLISAWNDTPGRTVAEVVDALVSVAIQIDLAPLMAPQTRYFATTGRTR